MGKLMVGAVVLSLFIILAFSTETHSIGGRGWGGGGVRQVACATH